MIWRGPNPVDNACGSKAVSYGNVTGYEDGCRNLRHRCQPTCRQIVMRHDR